MEQDETTLPITYVHANHKYYNLQLVTLCRDNFVRISELNLFVKKTYREIFHNTHAKQNKSIINNKRSIFWTKWNWKNVNENNGIEEYEEMD